MLGKRQFSIAYLFLEVLWVAASLAVSRWIALTMKDGSETPEMLFPVAVVLWGTSIGGLFARMARGAVGGVIALIALVLISLLIIRL